MEKLRTMDLKTLFDRQNPYLSSISKRISLCGRASQKDTRHLELSLGDSNLTYEVGDSLAVFPKNDPRLVSKTLQVMRAQGNEVIQDKKGVSYSFYEFLSAHVNLKGVTKKIVGELASRLSSSEKAPLERLLEEDNKEQLKAFLHAHELWDLLEHFKNAHFTPQEFASLAMPLLPRFYSIASSQKAAPTQVDLTVSYLVYESRGIPRVGTCTHFLCQLVEMHKAEVPIYVQPAHDFRLPIDGNTPIIMVGPGTGVAPFRAFMQEREACGHRGKNWLFFGEWTKAAEFYYQEDLTRWEKQGLLKLETAFSRDQAHKIYVQDRLREKGGEVFAWLQEGAILYVCGDAHRMAKDVDAALHEIVATQGGMAPEEAHAYMKRLRAEKRYLRDVY